MTKVQQARAWNRFVRMDWDQMKMVRAVNAQVLACVKTQDGPLSPFRLPRLHSQKRRSL